MSAVITKSWPSRHGEAVVDFGEILKYLLTGPDVKHLFKLYSMFSGRGVPLSIPLTLGGAEHLT